MKKFGFLIVLVSFIAALSSCSVTPSDASNYKFQVTTNYNGFYSVVYCDSASMISPQEVDAYVDGAKIKIKTDGEITIESSRIYKKQ